MAFYTISIAAQVVVAESEMRLERVAGGDTPQVKADDKTTAVQTPEENTVIVTGRARQKPGVNPAGKTLIIVPSNLKNDKSSLLFDRDASFTLSVSGSESSAGFVNPNSRSRETRFNEIYLDDNQVLNPHLGLTLLEDIDLRSFGALQVYQGLGPYDLPTLNPTATLRFVGVSDESEEQATTLGVDIGRPLGAGYWGLWRRDKQKGNGRLLARTYVMRHMSDGRYSFYNNNSTPYNTTDDFIGWRQKNDQNSLQFSQYVNYQDDNQQTAVFVRAFRKNKNVPTLDLARTGGLNRKSQAFFADAIYTRKARGYLPLNVGLGMNYARDIVKTSDAGNIYPLIDDDLLESIGGSLRLKVDAKSENINSHCMLQTGSNQVDSTQALAKARRVQRISRSFYCGMMIETSAAIVINFKSSVHELTDRSQQDTDQNPGGSNSNQQKNIYSSSGAALSKALSIGKAYVQASLFKNPASMLARFGDGTSVRPNPDIDAERILHREAGVEAFLPNWGLAMTANYFKDSDTGKIVFVPIAVDATKAQNIAANDVIGNEFNLNFNFKHAYSNFSYARYRSLDLNLGKSLLLPGLPQRQYNLVLGGRAAGWDISLLSKLASVSYRDYANQIQVPQNVTHNLMLYYWQPADWGRWEAGLQVYNLSDIKKLPLEVTTGSNQDGYVSYSFSDGQPLPGRHFALSASATF